MLTGAACFCSYEQIQIILKYHKKHLGVCIIVRITDLKAIGLWLKNLFVTIKTK